MRNGYRALIVRKRATALVGLVLCLAGSVMALPPLETVTDGLEQFRSETGDVTCLGRLTYGGFDDVSVSLIRPWGEAPRAVEIDELRLSQLRALGYSLRP